MSENLVRVDDLHKSYGSFEALKGLSFSMQTGQCLGLLGSNGAGKSTTIRIICGQLQATSGQVEVAGLNPATQAKELHSLLGYIPDSQSLYQELRVIDNIDVFRKLYGVEEEATHDIIEKLGLESKKYEKVKKLSKGLKQRTLIARSLVHKPKLLLLDEPTTGLDPSAAESIYQILNMLKEQGTSLLLTTHLMNDVERLCDSIVFINQGEKVEEGSPVDLKQKYGAPRLEEIFIRVVKERL